MPVCLPGAPLPPFAVLAIFPMRSLIVVLVIFLILLISVLLIRRTVAQHAYARQQHHPQAQRHDQGEYVRLCSEFTSAVRETLAASGVTQPSEPRGVDGK